MGGGKHTDKLSVCVCVGVEINERANWRKQLSSGKRGKGVEKMNLPHANTQVEFNNTILYILYGNL